MDSDDELVAEILRLGREKQAAYEHLDRLETQLYSGGTLAVALRILFRNRDHSRRQQEFDNTSRKIHSLRTQMDEARRRLSPKGALDSHDRIAHLWSIENTTSLSQLRERDRRIEVERDRRAKIVRVHYATEPSFLVAPLSSLTTSYGIDDREVFVYRAFLGIKFGERPKMEAKNVTRVHANGWVWGEVVFAEGSAEPVKWRKVYRPEKVRREAERTLDHLRGMR